MVLCGAFWLKSTKTRSPRSSFHHASVISSGRRRASSRGDRDRAGADLDRVPPTFEAHVDVHATVAGRLRPADDADLVEQRAHLTPCFTDVVEGHAGLRVEVDAQLVGVLGIGGDVGPDVEAETAEVHRPHDVREVGGDEGLRRRAVRCADGRRLEPLGHVLRHALLEERRPGRAVGEPLHEHRSSAHRAQEWFLDCAVVLDEVELGLAAFGEHDLARARESHRPPRHLEVDGFRGGTVAR